MCSAGGGTISNGPAAPDTKTPNFSFLIPNFQMMESLSAWSSCPRSMLRHSR